jgi:hypothetical protein
MITKIETPAGQRWAIVFDSEQFGLEDICAMQNSLIELMVTAVHSDLFESSKDVFCTALKLLNCLLLDYNQCLEYQNIYIKKRNHAIK